MFRRLIQAPIRLRLPPFIVLSLIASISLLSYLYYDMFKQNTEEQAGNLSVAIAEHARGNVETWVTDVMQEVAALADDRTTKEAVGRLNWALTTQGASGADAIRRAYRENNPFPNGEKQNFDKAADGTSYDVVHGELNGHFRSITERSGYYDLFLIRPDGLVVYSVSKEDDFGTNVNSGRYSETGLGDAFRNAMASRNDNAVFVDFAPYAPSADQPASFMAQQVVGEDGNVIGVVVIQLPIYAIRDILTASISLESEDEIYLTAPDGRVRNTSRRNGLFAVMDSLPNLPQVEAARSGANQKFADVPGMRGDPVIAVVESFDIEDETWSIVVELDRNRFRDPLTQLIQTAFVYLAIGSLISIAVGYFIARSIIRPLQMFSVSMEKVSNDDYESEISGLTRHDEIGVVSRSLEAFRDKLKTSRDASAVEALKRQEQADIVAVLGDGMKELANGNLSIRIDQPFSTEYETLRENFNATVETMNELMRMIVENANEIHARAEEISSSSDDLSHRTENQAATLEQTAAALDELTASVREAADSASEVERVVTGARKDAEESGQVVSEAVDAMSLIRKSSSEISQIIGVIDDIAFQTNLLSLNAGVEAARAGDAGRGFAVVASEVRALAQRSSEAAKQIKSLITSSSEQVETGVGLVGRTGDALGSIIERVGNIDSLVTGIAAGSREQSIGLGEINLGMSQLDQVTQQNAAMVEEATAAATTLRNEAASLSQVVSRFKLQEGVDENERRADVIQFRSSSGSSKPNHAPDQTAVNEQPELVAGGGRWTDF